MSVLAMQEGGIGQSAVAGDCPVTAREARTQRQLGATRTDGQGRYQLTGLPSGADVEVTAALAGGVLLRTRLRLRERSCQADLDEDTTMAAMCRRLLDASVTEPTQDDQEVEEAAGAVCYRYQQQHRYTYRRHYAGERPDLSNEPEMEEAAEDLLVEAANHAVATALQTRTRAECQSAVTMIVAALRVRERMQFSWDGETRNRAALALENQVRRSPAQAAAAVAGALQLALSQVEMEQARDRLRQLLNAFEGGTMEAVEVCACLCVRNVGQDQPRLRTQEHVRQCLDALLGE
ncbi:MAG: hypothetical protein GX100_06340 [candidate division WS1 bacterium]|nr:hypothetical protein [candidate division WS1 bacterium]